LDIVTAITEPADKSKASDFTKAIDSLKKVKEDVEHLRDLHPKSLFNDKKRFIILFVSSLLLVVLLNVLGLLVLGK
jgi:hypothetical protein